VTRTSARLLCGVSIIALAISVASTRAAAADRYWDANATGVGRGGTGNWDLSSSIWSGNDNDVAGPYGTWSNGGSDNAFFGGTAGTITLIEPIIAHNLTFDAGGYTLTGNTLTLTGATPTIAANSGTTTIDSVIAGGAGLVKAGGGALSLNGLNTFTGDIYLNRGSIAAASDAALGATGNNIFTGASQSVTLTINGASTNRTIDIGDGGALTLGGSGAGSALITGNGRLSVGVGLTMSNDANTYTGSTTFNGVNGVAYTYFTSIGNLNEASSLGAPTTVADGTIIFSQSSQYSDNVIYIGDGDSSNRNWELNGAAAIIRNQGTGTLSITGDIATSGGSAFYAEDADIELLGILSGGNYTIGGSVGRTITLGGANTFTGATGIDTITVRAPVLADAGANSSFGVSNEAISLTHNGTMSYTGAGGSSNREWTIASGRILNDGSGALALTGAVDLGTTAANTFTLGGGFAGENTLSGVISGMSDIISDGAGTWVLGAANTRTGAVIVDAGTLRAGNAAAFGTMTGVTVNDGILDLNGFDLMAPTLDGTGGAIALGSATLTVDTADNTTYAGSITGSGNLEKGGIGTLTLTGANAYTGDTTIGGGGLTLDFSASGAPASDIIDAISTLNLAGGTLGIIGRDSTANSQSFDGLNVTAGSNQIAATSGAGGSVAVDFGTITRTGGVIDFTLPTDGAFTTDSTSLGGWATVNGSDYAKVDGGSIVAFTAADYSNKDAAVNWLTGDVISDAGGGANTPYSGTVGGSPQLGGLKYTAAAASAVTIGAGETLGIDGTIIVASSVDANDQTISGGSLTGSTGGGVLGILQNGGGRFTIASTIVDNGDPTGFTKSGEGIVRLTGANTYTGVTTLSGGTLQINSLANGGVASSIGKASADASNLVLESGTLRYVGSTDSTTDRGFTLVNGGASAPSIQIDAGQTIEFSGLVTSPDDAGLTKSGWGTLVLSNDANDYTGVTTITGGGAGSSSTLSVNTLADGDVASGIGAASSDSSNLVLSDGGRLQYTGGTVDIDRGFTLDTGSGRIDVTQATTTLTIDGTAVGVGGLLKEGDGTLVLTGTNTYAGNTTVDGGTLRAGSSQAFGAATNNLTVNSGGTAELGGFDITAGALIGAGTVDLGAKTLTTSGRDGTFTGRITGTGGFTREATGGVQTMSGCNSDYTGVTTIYGTLSVDCLADGGDASGIGASGPDSANLVFDDGRLTYTGGSASIDRGFTLDGDGYVKVDNAATVLEFGGTITGAGRLRKEGGGILLLSGTNTYTGDTIISGGTVRVGSNDALGERSALFGNTAGATLDLDSFDTTIGFLSGGGALGGDVTLGSATLTLNWGSGSGSFAGAISGSGGLIKNGGITQSLTGCTSDYTGSTVINAGVLEVSCLDDGGAASSIGASTAGAGNLTINGGTLRYAGTGGSTNRQFTLGASGGNVLDASGTGAIDFTSSAAITFASADTAQTLTLAGTNTDDNILAAGITNNGPGVTSLTKTGDGTWILTNPTSSYTGITTVSGGVLGVDNLANGGLASSLGASTADAANLVIGNGSTLRYTGAGDTTNRLFTLAAGTTFIESSGTGAIVFTDTGPVTLADNNYNRTIALGGTNTGANTLAGSIGNAGSGVTTLAKNDAGNWVLTGTNSYTGMTVINGGTLTLGGGGATGSIVSDVINAGVLAFDRSDSYTYGGTITGAGVLAQNGAGTTILTGTSVYTGATNVNAGVLRINGDQSGATGLTTVASGAALGGSGVIGGDVLIQNGGHLAPGNSPGTLTIAGDLDLDPTSVLDMEFGEANVVGGALNDLIDVGGDLTLDGTVNITTSTGGAFDAGVYRIISYDGILTDNTLDIGLVPGSSSDVFVQTSVAQQVNLVNTAGLTFNYWDGSAGPKFNSAVNGGTGIWQSDAGNDNWTDIDGIINMPFATDSFAIFSAAPGAVTVDTGGGTVSASGMQFMSDGYVIDGDTLTLTGAPSTIRVGDGTLAGAGMTATIDAELAGTTQLVKTDRGTLILSGTNSYTGGTAIEGGTLSISDDVNLGAAGGAVSLNGGTLQTTADMASTRAVTLDGAGTLRTDAGTTFTAGGIVSGTGALTKDGAGTIVFTADNAYTGGTTIAAGTLQLGSGGAGGAIQGDVANAGVLAFNRSGTQTFAGQISGTGHLEHMGPGTMVLTADNSYTGGTTIFSGTLQLGYGATGGTTGWITGDVTTNAALTFNRSDDLSFDGLISGGGGIIKNGTGTITLTADNSYSSSTTVNTGTLLINGDQTAATGLTAVAPNATLGGDGIIGGDTVVDDGATLAPGTDVGTLTINDRLLLQGDNTVLDYDFGQSDVVGGPLNDLTVVGGDLRLNGRIDVTVAPGGSFDVGLYRIISYGGALTDNGLDLGTMPAGSTPSVQIAVAGQVNLVNTAGLTLNYWDGDAGARLDGFVAGGNGTWQAGGDDNWADITGNLNAAYSNDAFAIFSAAPGAVMIDNGAGQVSATGMQFASDGYTISGDALTLTGTDAIIRVGDGTADGLGYTATVASEITGSSRLVKTDLGTLILTGANSYGGGTSVVNGRLLVNGDQSAATGLTSVGAATLGGDGIIGGDVDVAGGTLAPGSNGAGTLTITGSLSLDDASTLAMEFGEADVEGGALNDLVNVGGDLALAGTLNVTVSTGGSFAAGIYRVFNYGGTLTDNGLALGAMPAGSHTGLQTAVTGQVNLVNTAGLSLSFWDGAAGPKFDGVVNGGDGVWQNGTGNDNWTDQDGTVNAPYQDAGFPVFAGTPGTVTVDDSLGAVSAAGLQFASDGYTITGDALELVGPDAIIRVGDGTAPGGGFTATIAAELTGAGRLVKTDFGTLILTGANSYTGGTAVNDGTLVVSADANLGDAAGGLGFAGGTLHTTGDLTSARTITLDGAGTFNVDDATTFTANGAVSGAGALTKSGQGTMLLTGNSSAYAGAAMIEAGTLAVDGTLGGGLTVASAGRLAGNGQVGSVANAGTVSPGHNGFGTLTVAGDYAGQNGTLEIEAELGGDGSPSDRLVVQGATSGATLISVTNRDGLGAATTDGIKIVDVAGASNGTFAIEGDYVFEGDQAMVAGAYGYRLYKNGVADPQDGDWYLRSSLLDSSAPQTPQTSDAPLYQPGVPLYEAYAGVLQSFNTLETLRQRVGARSWQNAQDGNGVWARMGIGHRSLGPKSTTSGTDYDVDRWQFQAGADAEVKSGDSGRLVAGLSGRYGTLSGDITSVYGAGKINTDGYGLGATLTWYGATGFYVDGQADATWYQSDLLSYAIHDTVAENNDASGYGGSIEMGQRFALDGHWALTPQVQWSYSAVDFDDFTDTFGARVSLAKGRSAQSRIGLAADFVNEWTTASGKVTRVNAYGIANLYYDFADGTRAEVTGTSLRSEIDELWGGLGYGFAFNGANDRYSIYAEVSADTSLAHFGNSYSVRTNAGVRIRW
jgi:fibronectin-binding autotransporter adhesin